MSLIETRAEALGVKVGPLKRQTATRIRKARALMAEVAGLWGDIDQAMVEAADDLALRLDEMTVSLDHSVELMGEPYGSDW